MAEKELTMDMSKDDITLVGFVLTWVAGIFGYGKIYGGLVSKINTHGKKIEAIEKTFFTIEGEPRLMSYAAHDQISRSCRDLINERIGHSTERLDKQEKVLDEIREGVNEMRGTIRQRSGDQGVSFGRRKTDTE